jgi:death-on-curing protein
VSDWTWIDVRVVAAIHDRQLAEHGGLVGVRDAGALDSALARPQNLAAYGDPDAPALAAAYAFGIARNHPFADGNKRTAWVLARLFLSANNLALQFDKLEAIRTVEALAAGQLSEDELGQWFRHRLGRA